MNKSKVITVGIFIVGGAVLFTIGLFLIGSENEVFGHHFYVYTNFANVSTLQNGAKVRVSGMDAGEVSEIEVPKQGSEKFHLKLSVEKKFQGMVRADSVAKIDTEGMVGNKFVNLSTGSRTAAECVNGCTVSSEEPIEISDLMKQGKELLSTTQGTISDLQHRADAAIGNITKASGHADQMLVSVRGNVDRIASNGAQITDDVRNGHGTIGNLLTDDQIAKNVQQTTENLRLASRNANDIVTEFKQKDIPEDAHATIANARDMMHEMKNATGDFLTGGQPKQDTVAALRNTVNNVDRASRNVAADTEAVKHNFFLRGFFNRRGFYDLTHFNRTEYDESDFVKHPKKRIWLSAKDLFTTSAKGDQELSAEGRSLLNRAMSQLTADLPNNPIMIEGYSDSGSEAERYLDASQRAEAVKQYLHSIYELKPDLLGTIAMEDKPPRGIGLESWNGVCLALVVSRN